MKLEKYTETTKIYIAICSSICHPWALYKMAN